MELTESNISPFYRIKGLIIGNQGVGKSSIINMFKYTSHDSMITSTIGIDFASFMNKLDEYIIPIQKLPKFYFENTDQDKNLSSNYNQAIRINIFDTSGSRRFGDIIKSYMRDIDIAFLVFDMSDRQSWDDLIKWKNELDKNQKYIHYPSIVLIGTKVDLEPHTVTLEEIAYLCKEWNAKNYIISCVQQSSSSMIKRMLYQTILDFHKKVISLQFIELPEHLTKTYYETKEHSVDLDTSTSKLCCLIS